MTNAFERWMADVRWAATNLRHRRWRAVLVVALLAVSIAANALVFATADSLVFRRVPYPAAERLVSFDARNPATGRSSSYSANAAALDEWRRHTDLFQAVHAYRHSVIFLTGAGEPELVNAADVTAGLIESLGARAAWGRTFAPGEERRADLHPVLIAESLARERFGEPASAIGQRLDTTAEPLLVTGVMSRRFRFPSGNQRIWRALDPRGPRARNVGLTLIARLSPSVPLGRAAAGMVQRSPDVAAAIGARTAVIVTPVALTSNQASDEQRRLLFLLLGFALCLLLIACANIASLELASAVARVRIHAVQLALGASRASIVRRALLEGAAIVVASTAAGLLLAEAGADVITGYLPRALVTGSPNPVDIDLRAILFMAAISALTWVLSSLPAAIFAARTPLFEALKLDGHSSAGSRGGMRLRQILTAAQVSIAVVLLVGAVLYVRSYIALLSIDKGFDSSGVVSISLTVPPQSLWTTANERHLMTQRILEQVRRVPGVIASFAGSPPPHTGDSPTQIDTLEMDDRPPLETDILLPRLWVTRDYFDTLRIPLLSGRMLDASDPPDNVLITEALARHLWPGDSAVGHSFRETSDRPWQHIVGVVGHVRTLQDGIDGPDRYYQVYAAMPTPKPAAAPVKRNASAGPSYGFLTITARIDSPDRVRDVYAAARAADVRNILKVELVDDQYSAQFADRLLATRLISAFGALAFAIAIAGTYGLMAFVVADRTREIGVRMALGAAGGDVRRLIIGSAMRIIISGAVVGIGMTMVLTRWIQSQLYGISAADPMTMVAVTAIIVLAAALATVPASLQAARVDPRALFR